MDVVGDYYKDNKRQPIRSAFTGVLNGKRFLII